MYLQTFRGEMSLDDPGNQRGLVKYGLCHPNRPVTMTADLLNPVPVAEHRGEPDNYASHLPFTLVWAPTQKYGLWFIQLACSV